MAVLPRWWETSHNINRQLYLWFLLLYFIVTVIMVLIIFRFLLYQGLIFFRATYLLIKFLKCVASWNGTFILEFLIQTLIQNALYQQLDVWIRCMVEEYVGIEVLFVEIWAQNALKNLEFLGFFSMVLLTIHRISFTIRITAYIFSLSVNLLITSGIWPHIGHISWSFRPRAIILIPYSRSAGSTFVVIITQTLISNTNPPLSHSTPGPWPCGLTDDLMQFRNWFLSFGHPSNRFLILLSFLYFLLFISHLNFIFVLVLDVVQHSFVKPRLLRQTSFRNDRRRLVNSIHILHVVPYQWRLRKMLLADERLHNQIVSAPVGL